MAGTLRRVTDLRTRPVLIDDAPGEEDGVPCLWAWIAIDAMGGEGIMAAGTALGMMPLVTAREEQARGAMRKAVLAMPPMGRTYELRRYEFAEVVEQL